MDVLLGRDTVAMSPEKRALELQEGVGWSPVLTQPGSSRPLTQSGSGTSNEPAPSSRSLSDSQTSRAMRARPHRALSPRPHRKRAGQLANPHWRSSSPRGSGCSGTVRSATLRVQSLHSPRLETRPDTPKVRAPRMPIDLVVPPTGSWATLRSSALGHLGTCRWVLRSVPSASVEPRVRASFARGDRRARAQSASSSTRSRRSSSSDDGTRPWGCWSGTRGTRGGSSGYRRSPTALAAGPPRSASGRPRRRVRAYEEALEWHEKVELPLDRGRTLLALGAAQRRAKRRREARGTLEEALAVFERIGATLWAERREASSSESAGARRLLAP